MAGGVCDRVAVRVRVRLLDGLGVRVVLIEGLRVCVGVRELVGDRVPLRVAVWVAGGELDGVGAGVAEAEEEADELEDADDDAVNVECGLRLFDFVAGAERVGVDVIMEDTVGVSVVVAVDDRV